MIRLVGAVSPYILFAVAAVPFLAGSGLNGCSAANSEEGWSQLR